MNFDFQSLQDILVCPETHSPLVHDGERLVSVDPERRLCYPILDDIPIMLIDEAAELSVAEWSSVMQKNDRHPQTGEKMEGESANANSANT